jgi:uncharacterized protein YkwD
LFLGLGALMVAWAAEDTSPQAIATRHREPRATTTTLPATTTTVTTVAPAPEPPLPEPETAVEPPPTTAALHVAGIVATQPEPVAEPAPAPEPDPAPAPTPTPAPPSPAQCPAPGGMLNTHNSIRCQNGLNQLGLDGAMSGNAQFHAERLMNAGACSSLFHAPELGSWYSGSWAENLACYFSSAGCVNDPGSVIDSWMASPEHHANILNPNYSWIGTGYACDGQHAYFVVQYRG